MNNREFWVAEMGEGLSEYSPELDIKTCREVSYVEPDEEFFGKWLDVHLLLEASLSQESISTQEPK